MSAPDISEEERAAVAAVLNTPVLSMGEHTKAFEDAISEYSGAKHAIAVSSGTAGLHLCVRAAGIEDGDLVLTSPFSFVSSSNVLLYERAVPIFVDVSKPSGNIDVDLLAKAAADISSGGTRAEAWLPRKGTKKDAKLKAILAVDIFGQPADYEKIKAVAEEYDLKVIEDSCEAIGAQYRGRSSGLLGDTGVFAFYPNKQMTTGEGGVIVTDDDEAAALMRSLRNQGRGPGDTWLQHQHLGYNYRLTELSAVLGRAQLKRLDSFLEKRAQVADWYSQCLEDVAGLTLPEVEANTSRMSWFLYVVQVDEGIDRNLLIASLDEDGIPSRPYFAPIHLQPFMRERFAYEEGDFPISEEFGRRGLALPFSSIMTEKEVALVCESLKKIMAN